MEVQEQIQKLKNDIAILTEANNNISSVIEEKELLELEFKNLQKKAKKAVTLAKKYKAEIVGVEKIKNAVEILI